MRVGNFGRRIFVLVGCFVLVVVGVLGWGMPTYASQVSEPSQMQITLRQRPLPNGQILRYEVVYTNIGGSKALSVVITDQVPVGARVVPGSISTGGRLIQPQSGGGQAEIHWSLGDVAPGGHGLVSYAIYLSSPPEAVVVHVTKTLVFPKGRPAEVGKDASIQWQIVLRNDGSFPLGKLPMEDSWRFVCMHSGAAADPPPDHVTGNTLQWDDLTGSGMLAAGQSITVTVRTIPVGACNPAWNQASVTGAEDGNGVPVLGMKDSAAVKIVAPTATPTPVPTATPTPVPTSTPTLNTNTNLDADPDDGSIRFVVFCWSDSVALA